MKYELTELELDEVSLVDSPANQAATVCLFKRNDTLADKTEIEKAAADLAARDAEIVTLKTQVEELTKSGADLTLAKEAVEKADDMIDFGGEKVAKSTIPAPVLKKLEELNKAAEVEELRKRAREVLPNTKGTEDQRGKLLKSVGDDAELLAILTAADALFGEKFKEVGKSDPDGDMKTPAVKLEEMAKAYAVEKDISYYKAYEAVTKTAEGKALLLKTYN